ncbi:peptide deformylase [Tropicibacter sp. S64]|uniref:peptide deformylase n=1 Tax=Tropicibacter sp. S64 TaxID=3415122 RepID=UPI003C7D259C
MSVLPVLKWPDPRLAQVCAPVGDVTDLRDVVADMFETMYAAPGRGLAGPQVGVMARVFVMDAGWKEGAKTPLACINPEILVRSEEMADGPEGCLSVPGVTAEVARHRAITLAYTDLDGVRHEARMTGAAAIIAQHEYDHLDGVMHFDRLGAAERAAVLAEYEALA